VLLQVVDPSYCAADGQQLAAAQAEHGNSAEQFMAAVRNMMQMSSSLLADVPSKVEFCRQRIAQVGVRARGSSAPKLQANILQAVQSRGSAEALLAPLPPPVPLPLAPLRVCCMRQHLCCVPRMHTCMHMHTLCVCVVRVALPRVSIHSTCPTLSFCPHSLQADKLAALGGLGQEKSAKTREEATKLMNELVKNVTDVLGGAKASLEAMRGR
jgi:hypothetical protein